MRPLNASNALLPHYCRRERVVERRAHNRPLPPAVLTGCRTPSVSWCALHIEKITA